MFNCGPVLTGYWWNSCQILQLFCSSYQLEK